MRDIKLTRRREASAEEEKKEEMAIKR